MNEVRVSNSADDSLSKNAKREAAREKARQTREDQKKKERRNRFLLQGGIVVGALAIVAIVGLVIVNSVKPEGPGPLNMASDGIQIGEGYVAAETPALAPGEDPVPTERAEGELNITMYVDYLCPICRQFEETNADYISSLLENGGTTVDIHPITILDRLSQGTKYSTRAANAASCVANSQPNHFYDYHLQLFVRQPEENTAGLTDDELIGLLKDAGIEDNGQIASCIKEQTFRPFVVASTDRALNGPIPNSNVDKVEGTPTVIVNGMKYEGAVDDLASFQAFVVSAAGETFNDEVSTPTPTPTPAG
jgi:protein-disulfide isomerase